MLNNKSKFYKWTNKKAEVPAPFYAAMGTSKRCVTEIDGVKEDVGYIFGLINAAVSLAQEELASCGHKISTWNHSHMAASVSTVEGGNEAIFTEYRSILGDHTQAAFYNPASGDLFGCVREEGQTITTALKFDGTSKDIISDCEVAWAALLIYAERTLPQFIAPFNTLKNAILSSEGILSPSDADYTEAKEGVEKGLAPLCWYMYMALSKTGEVKLSLGDSETKFRKINSLDLESGKISPAKGKRIIDKDFEIFTEGRTLSKTFNPKDIDWEKYYAIPFDRTEKDFTKEELLRIPEADPNESPSPILIGILDEIERTWKKRPVLRTSRILLEGGSGTGKTYLARSIARHLKRPYATHICGSTDGPEEFQGIIVPYVNRGGKKVLTPTPEMPESKLREYLSNPSFLWPKDFEMDVLYDPEAAKGKVTSLIDTLTSMMKTALNGAPKESSGISYEYIPSSISAAIENGWVLEVQEATCLIQQSALSCLYDVLDKGSEGYFKTPCGEIKRHPDFICVFTQNRKYKGTKPLNEAARNRFTFIEKMEDPSKAVITSRLMASTGVTDTELVSDVVDLYIALKDKAEDLNADGVVSFRNLQDFLDALADGVDTRWAFERYLLNAITTDAEDQSELIEAAEDSRLLEGIYA